MDEVVLGSEFFAILFQIDEELAAKVAAGGCAHCGGPLHRGDYPRKPRGGLLGVAGEIFTKRLSFCCGQEGCRRRATPPSVRFFGRRIYLGGVVIVASIVAMALATAGSIRRTTGIAARTTRRWIGWWRGSFVATSVFLTLSGRFVPAVSRLELPCSLLERFQGDALTRLQRMLLALCALTTNSISDCARLLRDIVRPIRPAEDGITLVFAGAAKG